MSEQSDAELIGRIPVRNLWLLMLYASDLYKRLRDRPERLAAEENPDEIPDLVAEILTVEVERRMRRMLTHELQCMQADLTRIRGRINHIRTRRRHLLQQGRIACHFDEFVVDTPRNRFVMAALNRLSAIVRDQDLRLRCRTDAAAFARYGVSNMFDARQIANMRNTRHNQDDARMVAAAHLAWDLTIPTERSGNLNVVSLDRNKTRLVWTLFERAVGGFYDVVLDKWRVHQGRMLRWPAKPHTDGILEILPEMKTDITVEKLDGTHRIVIDTKFTEITMQWHDRERLKSPNMYQIYSYLRSQEHNDDDMSMSSAGILLYPSVGIDYDESATIQGHKIRFVTVDLASDAADIRKRLLGLIPDYSNTQK